MIRKSVSVAIHDDSGHVLVVLRPLDDDELPNLWGLPAASLRPGESEPDAVRRAARDKLGVDVAVGASLRSGQVQRAGYTLEMTLYEARITNGTAVVPQPDSTVTQYASWKWGDAADLQPAAGKGSLCCRLYLDHAVAS